jgi:hypothetical protein
VLVLVLVFYWNQDCQLHLHGLYVCQKHMIIYAFHHYRHYDHPFPDSQLLCQCMMCGTYWSAQTVALVSIPVVIHTLHYATTHKNTNSMQCERAWYRAVSFHSGTEQFLLLLVYSLRIWSPRVRMSSCYASLGAWYVFSMVVTNKSQHKCAWVYFFS